MSVLTTDWLPLLQRVHAYTRNMFHYIPEAGKRDVWKTPEAFMLDLGGDCEDFAIYEYHLLKSLGYSADNLRLAHVRLDMKGPGRDHMILLARAPSGDWLGLDHRFRTILTTPEARGMRVIYSFNEKGMWVRDVHMYNRYPKLWRAIMIHL